MGSKAVRVDMLERFAAEARRLAREGKDGFVATPQMLSLLGLAADEAGQVLSALGFRRREHDGTVRWLPAKRGNGGKAGRPHRPRPREDSPFAVLRGL